LNDRKKVGKEMKRMSNSKCAHWKGKKEATPSLGYGVKPKHSEERLRGRGERGGVNKAKKRMKLTGDNRGWG